MYKVLTTLLIVLCSFAYAEDGNYAIAVGEEDKERFFILNEIYNPSTEQFLEGCRIAEGDSVLDLGCGLGLVSQKLAAMVGDSGRVLATDISEEQLPVAKSLGGAENLEFRKHSVYELCSLEEKFDVVYVRLVLSHLSDQVEVLRQVKNVLKPDGTFIIEDFTGNHTLYTDPVCKGLEVHQYFDKLQFEVQQSDDCYFEKLSDQLREEGFCVMQQGRSQPRLDTIRQRKMLTYDLSSLKSALIQAGKLTVEEYESLYPFVEELVQDISVAIYTYEIGHLEARLY